MARMSRRTLRRWVTVAIVAVAAVVVILLALILGGVLVLPGSGPASVTITGVHLVVLEGNTSNGIPWFGPTSPSTNYTTGFPLSVGPGKTFSIVWASFINFDSVAHTIRAVTWTTSPATNVTKPTTVPGLPDTIPADGDDENLGIYMTAPSTPGATYAVTVVVDALNIP